MIGVTPVGGNETLDDFPFVDALTGFGLESQSTPGQYHFAIPILRQDDVVVEYAKYFHRFVPSPDGDVLRRRQCWISITVSPAFTSISVFGVTEARAMVLVTVISVVVLYPACLTLSKSTVTRVSPAFTR